MVAGSTGAATGEAPKATASTCGPTSTGRSRRQVIRSRDGRCRRRSRIGDLRLSPLRGSRTTWAHNQDRPHPPRASRTTWARSRDREHPRRGSHIRWGRSRDQQRLDPGRDSRLITWASRREHRRLPPGLRLQVDLRWAALPLHRQVAAPPRGGLLSSSNRSRLPSRTGRPPESSFADSTWALGASPVAHVGYNTYCERSSSLTRLCSRSRT